jgi:DNA-binding transcriptional LysR family regulator
VMQEVRKSFPRMRFSLHSTGFQSEVEEWLRAGQVDVAFVPVYPRVPAGLKMTRLARLPLILQVHSKSKWKAADELWTQKRITEPLICLPENTGIMREFFSELKRRGIVWRNIIEASSLDLVTRYVANGDGIGLNVQVRPGAKSRGVRALALNDFAPMTMGALWRGEPSPLVQAAVGSVRAYARTTWPEWACEE